MSLITKEFVTLWLGCCFEAWRRIRKQRDFRAGAIDFGNGKVGVCMGMIPRLTTLLFTFSCALMPALGQGQSSWDDLRQAVKTGQKLRVIRMNLASVEGKLAAISDGDITIEQNHESRRIERNDVFRVSRSGQRSRHALWGLAIGAGVGAAMGGAIVAQDSNKSGLHLHLFDDAARVVPLMSGIVGAAGSGVGAALPANATLYRAPQKTSPQTASR